MIKSLNDCFVLSNGVKIPCVGFGTWQTQDGATAVTAVETAIKAGYKHIDTAAAYGNEKSVGDGIKNSGVDRKELFITTKLWNSNRGYDKTMKAFEESMKLLGLDYLDLYLIHWPASGQHTNEWRDVNASTWKAFEELYKAGKIKSIGVSNFLVHHLMDLMGKCEIAPMVNQVEYHPGYTQPEIVDYCRRNNILVQAWSPLGCGRVLEDETLMKIAAKYGKSTAQICIKWALQNDTLPLPKSATPSRIIDNTNVFDFDISCEDMKVIDAFYYVGYSGMHPDEVTF